MPRIAALQRTSADSTTAATLDAVKAKLGMVPNLFSTFARAPAGLQAYLGFDGALRKGKLTARQREIISLAVGPANSCQYCLSAHTTTAKLAGLTESEVRDARAGGGRDRLEGQLPLWRCRSCRSAAISATATSKSRRPPESTSR